MATKRCGDNDRTKFINFVDMRAYFEALLAEREKMIEVRFQAVKDSTTAAFMSSEKAIIKAEAAQAAYNERSNEFRSALDDQSKTMMPRHEGLGMHAATAEKLNVMQIAHQKDIDAIRSDISQLREFRSSETARAAQVSSQQGQRHWGIEMLISVIAVAISLAAIFVHYLH